MELKLLLGDSLDMMNYLPIAIPSCLLRPITKRLADDMSSIVEREGLLGATKSDYEV